MNKFVVFIVISVLLCILNLGFLGPALISAQNTVYVILGVLSTALSIFAVIYSVYAYHKSASVSISFTKE